MTVTTTKYVRKILCVEAVRITSENFEEIADWCQGDILTQEKPGAPDDPGKRYIRIRVHNPMNARQTKAFVGDWILYTDKGYKIFTNNAFRVQFDELSEVKANPPYPYDEGDVTVLGPELFVSRDNSMVCWKGMNYIPQGDGDGHNQVA